MSGIPRPVLHSFLHYPIHSPFTQFVSLIKRPAIHTVV